MVHEGYGTWAGVKGTVLGGVVKMRGIVLENR